MIDAMLSADAPVTVPSGPGGPKWIAEHRDELRELLLKHGAVLLTGVDTGKDNVTAEDVAAARDALGAEPVAPVEDFAPREDLGHGVWSAPAWAADREMCLHHERSQAEDHPRLLVMACARCPDTGGATLLADTRAVLAALPLRLVERFREHGWLLTRNFRPHFGLPWSAAFGVTAPAEVERLCADRGIRAGWLRDGTLHTTQRRTAVVEHPDTGEECWFNQVAFFSRWSLAAEERDLLLGTFGEHGIPFDTAYGDGTPLAPEEFQSVLDAYDSTLRRVPWKPGDLLLVDNVLTAHGREPHTGERLVAVASAR